MCEVARVALSFFFFFLPLPEPSNTFLSYFSKLTACFSLFNLVLHLPEEGFLLRWVDNLHPKLGFHRPPECRMMK